MEKSLIRCDTCGFMKELTDPKKSMIGWVYLQRTISEKEVAQLDFCSVDCMVHFVNEHYKELDNAQD